jgi:PAS domain S-box-containing protein
VFRDISERRQAESALKVSNTRLRTLIQAIPDMVIFKDERGRHVLVNRAVEEMTGYSRDAFIGKTAEDLLSPDGAAACRESDEAAMRSSGLTAAEEQVFEVDGRKRYVEMLKAPMTDENEGVVGLVARGRDVTERRLAEEGLRKSELFVRSILDAVDEAFIVVDGEFRILTANKAYGDQTGVSSKAAVGRHCYEISHRLGRPCHESGEECAVRSVLETGEPGSAVHQHPDGTGGIVYVETKAFPIRDDSGAVTSVIETVNNIT